MRMTCPQCGAAIKRGDGRFCSHCAAALPDRPRITDDEWRTHADRFDEAERDAQHGIALGLEAPPPQLMMGVVFPAIFLLFWLGVGSFIIRGFAEVGGVMALFPVLLVGFGVVMIGTMIYKTVQKAKAPVLRTLAVVVDKRTNVSSSGTGDDRRTSTSYYATLQFRDGSRLELPTGGNIAGHVTDGDIGLAVMRGGDLIDFHRYRL